MTNKTYDEIYENNLDTLRQVHEEIQNGGHALTILEKHFEGRTLKAVNLYQKYLDKDAFRE
jgi:hypothetical protein